MVETGAIVVGSISILTMIIAKLKCYAKKNGSCNYGCGFMDKSLIDDEEIDVKTVDLGSVHVMYVMNKHHAPVHEPETEEEDSEEE
jgi:hypothetical protein